MGFKRTRKGGKRRRVIANYFGICSRLHGRKKTRCLLDQKRDFWDALGFRDDEYKIYDNQNAQDAFLERFKDDEKLQYRVQQYLLENNDPAKRKDFYYKNKDNDVSPDDVRIKIPVTQHEWSEASAPKPGSKIPVTHRNKSFFDQPSIEPLAFQKGNPIIGTTSTTRVESEYDTPEVQTLRASSHSSVTPSKSNSRDILLRNVTVHSGTRSSQRQKKEAKRHRIIPVVNAYRNQQAKEETAAIFARRIPNDVLEFESESSETPQLTRRQRKRISQKQSKAAKLSEV